MNPSTADIIAAAAHAAQAVQSALNKDPVSAVGHALDAALVFFPAEELAPHLTEASIRRQKAIKAIADAAKFGPLGSR